MFELRAFERNEKLGEVAKVARVELRELRELCESLLLNSLVFGLRLAVVSIEKNVGL